MKRIYLKAFLVTQTFVSLSASVFILRRFDIHYLSRLAFLFILSLLLMRGIIGLVMRNSLVNQTNDKSFLKKINVVVYIAKNSSFCEQRLCLHGTYLFTQQQSRFIAEIAHR